MLTGKEIDAVKAGSEVTTFAQLYYLFYYKATEIYFAKPDHDTLHELVKTLRNPYHTSWSQEAITNQNKKFFRPDIETAAYLALIDLWHTVKGGDELLTFDSTMPKPLPNAIPEVENPKLPPYELPQGPAFAIPQPLVNRLDLLEDAGGEVVPNSPLDAPPSVPIRRGPGRPRKDETA